MRRIFSALAVTSYLLAGVPTMATAQTNPGLTFNWGGDLAANRQLPYRLDYGTPNSWDRYHLRLPGKKLPTAVSSISVTYPDYYKGTFDPKAVEVRMGPSSRKAKKLELSSINFDKENRIIEANLAEPVPAGKTLWVVLSNVRNPRTGGMYYFHARVNGPGDVPLPRYIGTWVMSISN